jgi:hypothetical protein
MQKGLRGWGPRIEVKANPKSPDYLGLASLLPLLSGSIGAIIELAQRRVCTYADIRIH